MKTSFALTWALASCTVTLAAPVSTESLIERGRANPISDPASLSVNPSAAEVSEDLNFGSEPGNEIGPISRRKRFVPATVLESRDKPYTSMSDLIDFANEPGNEILGGNDAVGPDAELGLKDRAAVPDTSAAQVEKRTQRSASVGSQTVDDNSLFDGWGFGDGPPDPISADPVLRNDDGFGDNGIP